MRFSFLSISLPSSAKQQREITKFEVLWRTSAPGDKFSFFSPKLSAARNGFIPEGLKHLCHIKRLPVVVAKAAYCTRASLNKTPTNYISLESLINVLDEKNTILAKFSFRKCQKPVRPEKTEGSSIEFIGYRIPKYEQNGCTVLFARHQSTKVCRAFSIF